MALTGDEESIGLANQFKKVFEDAGWRVNLGYTMIFGEQPKGLVLSAHDQLSPDYAGLVGGIIRDAGFVISGQANPKLPTNSISLQVGIKPNP